jgi:GT2 family glycosyltransferase
LTSLSIVILNYNGKDFLRDFLPSVIEHSAGHEIVIADNCSTDDSVEFLRTNHPDLRLILNSSNGGFAQGYNEALAQVKSEFYLLLNSDIQVTEGWLEPLLKTMDDPEVAGCQPKVRSFLKPTHLEHAGASGGFLDKDYFPFCRGRIFDLAEEDKGQYNDPQEIFWASGACLLIRANLYHEAGGLDEDFFAHMEEIDLCWRLKRKNYKFMVAPESVVYHVGGGTLPYSSPFKTYLNFRNSLFMLIKNHDGWLFPKLFKRLALDGIAGVRFVFRGEFKQLQALLKAHYHVYGSLGKFYKKRQALKRSSISFNSTGLYRGSLLWQKFVRKVDIYSQLPQDKF